MMTTLFKKWEAQPAQYKAELLVEIQAQDRGTRALETQEFSGIEAELRALSELLREVRAGDTDAISTALDRAALKQVGR